MTVKKLIDPATWPEFLAAFSERNRGRRKRRCELQAGERSEPLDFARTIRWKQLLWAFGIAFMLALLMAVYFGLTALCVVALLAEAHSDGRLTADEHAERVQRAIAARTLGELAELTADLVIRYDHPDRPALLTRPIDS